MVLAVGDKFPADVKFEWAPITDADASACGLPQLYDASKNWAGKKVVIISLPGAFTPSCSAYHVPPFVQKIDQLKAKGVDHVAILSGNDAWVMCAWGKVNKVPTDDYILMLSDTKTQFAKHYGWLAPSGDRNGRWGMIIEKDGTVSYVANESAINTVEVSSFDTIITKL